MPSPAPLDMRLVSCTFLDPWHVTMTVRECWTERRGWFFRDIEHERVKSYDLAIRVGRWLDGTNYVLRQDPRHFRLWELFGAWRMEQKFNRAVGIPADSPLLDG
jgi:hypothetical protein